jgi:hypothetical protein
VRTIDLAVRPAGLQEILKLADEDSLLLRTRDGKEYVLIDLEDFDQELDQTRQNQELMDALEQRSQEKGVYTLEQVREQLNLKHG